MSPTGSVKSQKSSTNSTATGTPEQRHFTFLSPVVVEFFLDKVFMFLGKTWLTFLCPRCSHPHLIPLEQAKLKQCVVGPNHAGFLLEVTSYCSSLFVRFCQVS